jgi:HEAT repeat protein
MMRPGSEDSRWPTASGLEADAVHDLIERCAQRLASVEIGAPQWIEARNALERIDIQYAPLLIEALADNRHTVCCAFSAAVARFGPPVFYDVIAAMEHEHPNVRMCAARLLYGLIQRGGVVGEDAVGPLAAALRDPDCRVRHQAAVTLSIVGEDARAAVPGLIRALSDTEDIVREWAAHALAAAGPAAKAAIPALTEALLDDEPCVRHAASDAIDALRPLPGC